MKALVFVVAVGCAGCGALTPPRPDAGGTGGGFVNTGGGEATGGGGGATGGGDGSVGTVVVEPVFEQRGRLGARSVGGFRPWRGGLAVVNDALYWVESGADAGLFSAPLDCAGDAGCVEQLAAVTRPSVFTATPDSVLVADVTVLRRYARGVTTQSVATGGSELVTLASDGAAAFWCTESSPVNRTPFGGVTSTPIHSNGTPYAMTVAGDRVYWVGVDISGQTAAIQSMRTDGTGAREVSRSNNGFQTLKGNAAYLYYARDNPARVFRLTLSNEVLEEVASNAQGVTDFALDDSYAYWVEPGSTSLGNGRVRRVSHESTTPELVAESIPYPVAIAVHRGVLYVASAGTQGAGWSDGRILRITLP